VLAAIGLAGCGSDPATDPPAPARADLAGVGIERVAGGFAAPLLVTAAPDGERILVVERTGTVWALRDGRRGAEPYLDVGDRISEGGERGLLGLAFHPDFDENGRLFVDYTDPAGDTRVVELSGTPGAESIDPEGREILRVEQPHENHNGGHLAFGPDGMLYVGLGDGGGAGDPEGNGQDPRTLLGTILRIDVDAAPTELRGYAIPADNPFADGRDGAPEVAHYGLRNPWRFSFDPLSGDLWIGDVGQATREEVDRIPAGTLGADLGWSVLEGTARHGDAVLDVHPRLRPVAEYGHDAGCSVIGGVVYRGARIPALRGTYLYADYCTGRIFGLDAADPGPPADLTDALGARVSDVRSFGVDAGGEVYLAAGDAVWRIVPTAGRRAGGTGRGNP
jgi:glucose/arabinose dehydrogenase